MIKIFKNETLVAYREDYSLWVAKVKESAELVNFINDSYRRLLKSMSFEEALMKTIDIFESKGLTVVGSL